MKWKSMNQAAHGDFYIRQSRVYHNPTVENINGMLHLVLSSSVKIGLPGLMSLELKQPEGTYPKMTYSQSWSCGKRVEIATPVKNAPPIFKAGVDYSFHGGPVAVCSPFIAEAFPGLKTAPNVSVLPVPQMKTIKTEPVEAIKKHIESHVMVCTVKGPAAIKPAQVKTINKELNAAILAAFGK
jgi:hypothetical protein